MTIIERARRFATKSHADQRRKYSGKPYIIHPLAVATLVSEVTDDHDAIAAALLHDVVEDCEVTVHDLVAPFGVRVAAFVNWLTHVDRRDGENRAERKARDREKLSSAPTIVKTIKLADLIDNAPSIIQHDAKFSPVFIGEMQLLLEVLRDGDPILLAQAEKIVQDYYETVLQ